MSRMFGERINEFVLSIDIMDQETFFDLLKLIQVYVNQHLDIVYFSVLDETTVDNKPGLRTLWGTRDERPSYTIDDEDGYSSHSAYTFGQKKPIWVVGNSKGSLQTEENLMEMWSDSEDLPPYNTQNQSEIKTSVMHPLTKDGRPVGVVEFAAKKYIEPSFASRAEVQTLAAVIARAYRMFDVRKEQRENTKNALKNLEGVLKKENWTRLALPQLFVAYSGAKWLKEEALDKHKTVIDTILGVLDEFDGILSIVNWADVSEAGNINEQVIHDISNSEFGLCYFSEPTNENEFKDNANVLFEAGMMQALTKSPNALLKAWLPIREKESPDIPFDIAAERILLVERENHMFNQAKFTQELRLRLNTLIENHKSSE